MKNKNKIKKVDGLLSFFLGGSSFDNVIKIKRYWKDIAGEMIAEIAFPYKYTDKTVYVALYDNGWMAEMPYVKELLIRKINDAGIETVDIKFTLSKVVKKAEKMIHNKKPLSDEEEKLALKIAENIKDDNLREAFTGAMKEYFRNKK